jgi:hypothetical protein
MMSLSSIAIILGGAVIALISGYLWRHPEQYDRYLHGTSPLAALNVRPGTRVVKLGAMLGVIIGLAVVAYGIGQLLA